MRKFFLLPALLILTLSPCFSQYVSDLPVTFEGRHHMVDSAELLAMPGRNKAFTPTTPPSGIVRAVAEWEPAEAVIISYNGGFGIPYSLIAEMSEDTRVITIVESASQQNTVTNNYNNNGVNLANCSFVIAPLNSYWSRDYSPWFIMVNHSEIAIIDFPYNRPSRVDDDNIPVVMAGYLNEDLYGMNISHTGGNFMCDGLGIAATTDLVTDENSLSEAQIDTLLKQFMGIHTNYILPDPLGEYIKHIDCWGKFLDVDKILIASVPVSHSQYTEYEAMAAFWAGETSSYGTPYQVFRVYEPNGQPYTNSLILNKKVFVPTVNGSGSSYNNAALAVYQQAMPGYEIIGISSNSWESTDALHCRTHEVADRGMLYIRHLPILGEQPPQSQFTISAEIFPLSGAGLIADSVRVFYRYNSGSWLQTPMSNTSANHWEAIVTQPYQGDTIKYFITAADASPRRVCHPLIGSPDPHVFYTVSGAGIPSTDDIHFQVFPNPATDFLFIKLNKPSDGVKASIFNTLGSRVASLEPASDRRTLVADVRMHEPGVYIIHVSGPGIDLRTKILVTH